MIASVSACGRACTAASTATRGRVTRRPDARSIASGSVVGAREQSRPLSGTSQESIGRLRTARATGPRASAPGLPASPRVDAPSEQGRGAAHRAVRGHGEQQHAERPGEGARLDARGEPAADEAAGDGGAVKAPMRGQSRSMAPAGPTRAARAVALFTAMTSSEVPTATGMGKPRASTSAGHEREPAADTEEPGEQPDRGRGHDEPATRGQAQLNGCRVSIGSRVGSMGGRAREVRGACAAQHEHRHEQHETRRRRSRSTSGRTARPGRSRRRLPRCRGLRRAGPGRSGPAAPGRAGRGRGAGDADDEQRARVAVVRGILART